MVLVEYLEICDGLLGWMRCFLEECYTLLAHIFRAHALGSLMVC
jgi:hypothetical protein